MDRVPGAAERGRLMARFDIMERQKSLTQLVKDYERGLVQEALDASAGNKTHTAELLGICQATLYKKIKKYGIRYNPDRWQDESESRLPKVVSNRKAINDYLKEHDRIE